jgi:RNA polymerase sigma-70 factor, ECF subfamily
MQNPAGSEHNDCPTAELVDRSLNGDVSAFRSLLEMYQQYAYAVAFRLLRDADNARDIVQEAFIRVWNHLHRYRPEVKFTTWLYRIVVHLCYDRMKMEARRTTRQNNFATDTVIRDIHQDVENADLREHVLSEAKKLPPQQRLVFHLRDIQDFSIEEIADMVGISINSVKANLCYARRRIRVALEQMQRGNV